MNARDRLAPSPRRESGRPLTSGAPLQTFALQRRCEVDGCGARLSRYNPSATCSVHRGWKDPSDRATYGG